MQFLLNAFPVILFFLAYWYYDIYVATWVIMIASVAQLLLDRLHSGQFKKQHLASSGAILFLGGMTLLLQNKAFLMWKPTILNWGFALGLVVTSTLFKQPVLKKILGSQISLPSAAWKRLTLQWVMFFIVIGFVNLFFVYQYETSENALLQAAPSLTKQELISLQCDDPVYIGEQKALCQQTKRWESHWVSFKLALIFLTLAFTVLQALSIAKYLRVREPTGSGDSK